MEPAATPLNLAPDHNRMVARISTLARERFAPRAADYDSATRFPREDFEDLRAAGLLGPVIPRAYGGLGLNGGSGDTCTRWMLTKELARANLSLARCWEGHINALMLLEHIANPAQKARWYPGVTQHGELWACWSGEPQSVTPGQKAPFGTRVQQVDGGYIVDGSKIFATSAGGARWAILLVSAAGPGGARDGDGASQVMMLACDLEDPSVSFDDSWWDPIGMRATVSHLARFDRTFIPDANRLGEVGQFHAENWQSRFVPQYAASFLGAAEGALDYARHHLLRQSKQDDPYVQQHIGQMAVNVRSGHLWLHHVAELWEQGDEDAARLAGTCARHAVEHLALDTVDHAIRACGARCLNRPSPLERIHRDLSFYVRHDNDDHVLANIGRSQLGLDSDFGFHRLRPVGSQPAGSQPASS